MDGEELEGYLVLRSWRGKDGAIERRKGRKLIAFMNSYSQGKSGGDVCFIEVAKRINKFDRIVITSLLGKKLCEIKGLKANYLITTKEQNFKKVISTYFKRIIKAFFLRMKIDSKDILYSTSDFLPDVLPAFYQKIKNKNVFWIQKIFHLIPSGRLIPHYAQKASFLFIKHFADLVIVDNRLLKEGLIHQRFNVNKIEENSVGIDTKYFKDIKAIEGKEYDATFLGRLHPSKGIFALIEIWKFVCKNIPDARLAIIGEGNERIEKELTKKILNVNLENNIFVLGYLDDDKTFKLMKSSKVFVFPSFEEGFGIAILEAMACGLPVIAWDLPFYKEIFPKGMIRVSIGKTKEFGDAVLKLLEDEQFREEISRETKEISQRFDWNEVAERELKLIENLVAR
jgi:glycosyltransferase involved in cell wall biosynthesis